MGYLYKGVCFPDLTTAQQHFVADQPTQWGSGSSLHAAAPSAVDHLVGTYTMARTVDGAPVASTTHPFPTFYECDHDGSMNIVMEFFPAILAFVVLAWAGSRMYKLFWGSHDPI